MKTKEQWKEIEQEFVAWDNATHSNASQRQIMDWFKIKFFEYASQFQQKAQQPITDEILGNDKSWPLKDVLDKLIEASEILLHEKNYDRHGWEEISHCVKRGKEIVSILVHKAQPGDNKERGIWWLNAELKTECPGLSPYLLSKDEIEETIKKRNQGYK